MKPDIRVLAVTVAAAALAVALYVSGGAALLADLATGAPAIRTGFIGIENFGRWRLICVSGPAPLQGLIAVSVSDNAVKRTNACRVNQEVHAPAEAGAATGPVLAAVNFSLLGAQRTPALMLRLPATAHAGDAIRLDLDGGKFLDTVVRECAAECLAAGPLSADDWARLSRAQSLGIAFPARDGEAALLDVPVDGLRVSMKALEKAQSTVSRLTR